MTENRESGMTAKRFYQLAVKLEKKLVVFFLFPVP